MRPVPACSGAMDNDHLWDTTWHWNSSPMAEVPGGPCAQTWPDIPTCPGDQDTRLLPSPSSPQDSPGSVPSIPRDACPGSGTPWGHLTLQWTFWPLIIFFSLFFLPEKLKQHKIIFVVGKSVSGSCRWWGQPGLFPVALGWGNGAGGWDWVIPRHCGVAVSPACVLEATGLCQDQDATCGHGWGGSIWGDTMVNRCDNKPLGGKVTKPWVVIPWVPSGCGAHMPIPSSL